MVNFSVLMSVYHKENPRHFRQAMHSIWDKQTLSPNEVILVEDGALTDGLNKEISLWKEKMGYALKIISLKENQGLANALNIGLDYCSYNYVARMDTDDICTPDRFEKQLAYLKENPDIDILGGQILEFEKKIGDMNSSRALPCAHDNLTNYAKIRCPFNHPTVIYRKSAVLAVNGYQNDYLYEDYALWVRMIKNGVFIANLPDTVLHMRSGDSMFKRRGGLNYAISEARAQYKFYQLGFLSITDLMKNLLMRLPIRFMPNRLRSFIYKGLLRKKNE